MKKTYKNALVNNDNVDIITENGIITFIGKTEETGMDLNGRKVYPGLIDIHTHGIGGYDTMDGNLEEMSYIYAKNGVTSYLPTTMTVDLESLKNISDINIQDIKGANILGFHFEGPYISKKYKGAQNEKYIREPDINEFKQFKNVKMVTVAPEVEGAMEFIENCDVIVSLGHTDADFETTITAIEKGAKCLTHTFNAMTPIHHREPGVIGAAVKENIYAQVICDGLHIHQGAINILYKLFGADKMILISDSMSATGLPEGKYSLGGQDVFVKDNKACLSDGTLAGSISTLFDCVKCAINMGIPECDAFKMATETPAKLLNVNKGKIEVGCDADFIVLDNNLNLKMTVVGGEIV